MIQGGREMGIGSEARSSLTSSLGRREKVRLSRGAEEERAAVDLWVV
jgi:hypothetical protein